MALSNGMKRLPHSVSLWHHQIFVGSHACPVSIRDEFSPALPQPTVGHEKTHESMRDYFIRRLLLIPPTLIGITIIVFAITRLAPGGPLERALMEAQQMDASSGTSASSQTAGQGMAMSEAQLQSLKEYYGFDKPLVESYIDWLGKVMTGDLGNSYRYNEPVLDVISDRFPISLYYGLTTLVITYLVCIPLGVVKAVRHRTAVDTVTSILIFIGFAVPGFALGSLLLLYFSVNLDWLPMGGFVSIRFADLGPWDQFKDLLSHSILPLICYLIGSFAFLTMLLKNNMMDNLAADYVRTAIAKGVTFRRAVTHHAMRNSLIPVATSLGNAISLLVGGSFFIEFVFDINGFGLLGLNAITDRDYPIVMGVALLSSALLLIGNVLSDVIVALVDPRIRFQ